MVLAALLASLLLAACAPLQWPRRAPPPPSRPAPERPAPPVVPSPPVEPARPVEPTELDPMAEIPGDGPLPPLQGSREQIDCLSGRPDLHARIAIDALGGEIASFAYYSRWNFYTCSIDLQRDGPYARWRRTPDGATRVQTPHGSFVIRAEADAYVFEFRDVERMRWCGMFGTINGRMKILRNSPVPNCTAEGIMDF